MCSPKAAWISTNVLRVYDVSPEVKCGEAQSARTGAEHIHAVRCSGKKTKQIEHPQLEMILNRDLGLTIVPEY